MSRWSDWLLFQPEHFESIPTSSGIYEIRWAVDGRPQPINRVNGVDESGLLYIGKTRFLRLRIASFWRYIKSERKEPPNAAAYAYVFYSYYFKFKPEQLEVRWMTLSEDKIDMERERLLFYYAMKYFDRPPLNISIKRFSLNNHFRFESESPYSKIKRAKR